MSQPEFTKFDEESAARALLEAMYSTDVEVAAKYGCTAGTIRGWRKRLRDEPWFVELVATEREAMRERWLGSLDETLGEAVRTIRTIARRVAEDPEALRKASESPAMLDALSRSTATLAQVRLSEKVIEARIALLQGAGERAEQDGPGPKQIGPGIVVDAEVVKPG